MPVLTRQVSRVLQGCAVAEQPEPPPPPPGEKKPRKSLVLPHIPWYTFRVLSVAKAIVNAIAKAKSQALQWPRLEYAAKAVPIYSPKAAVPCDGYSVPCLQQAVTTRNKPLAAKQSPISERLKITPKGAAISTLFLIRIVRASIRGY